MNKEQKDVPVFIIDRAKLRCGGNAYDIDIVGNALLLNKVGRMCCLGQICEQCGIPREALLGISTPRMLDHKYQTFVPSGLLTEGYDRGIRKYVSTQVANDMVSDNDLPNINQQERERRLKASAIKAGFRMKFVGKLGLKRGISLKRAKKIALATAQGYSE